MKDKDTARHYRTIRAELAEMLGYRGDPDALPIDQSTRLDVVFGLKVALDEQRGRMYRGEAPETAEMLRLSEALERYLPRQPEPEVDPHDDPHARLMEIIENWIEGDKTEKAEKEAERVAAGLSAPVADLKAAQSKIDELEARLAEFESVPDRKALPVPDVKAEAEKVITPSIGDIVPPGEQGKLYVGPPPRTPDDIKAMRPKPVIDHEPAPPKRDPNLRPVPGIDPLPTCSGAESERRRQAVNADKSFEFRIMNAPSGPNGVQPSNQAEPWRSHEANDPRFWNGEKGRNF